MEEISRGKQKKGLYLGYSEGRAPLLFEDVKADTAITIDVWVKNLCAEGNLKCKDGFYTTLIIPTTWK